MIVAWACEYEVTNVFGYARAGALWAFQKGYFSSWLYYRSGVFLVNPNYYAIYVTCTIGCMGLHMSLNAFCYYPNPCWDSGKLPLRLWWWGGVYGYYGHLLGVGRVTLSSFVIIFFVSCFISP